MELKETRLHNLEIGNHFYAASDKKRLHQMLVDGNAEFNAGHGSATRRCYCYSTRKFVSKSCNLKVVVS